MASAVAPSPALSDAELVDLLALVRQSDSVELELTVPEDQQRSAITALGLDPLGAQVRLRSSPITRRRGIELDALSILQTKIRKALEHFSK